MSLNIHIRKNNRSKKQKTLRVDQFEILNQTDALYYTVQCKSVNGVPVLYLSDAGKN